MRSFWAHRRTAVGVSVLAAVALLSGCAVVPISGPIEQGVALAVGPQDQFIRVIARPPQPGMSAEEVVRGFQEATASADAGYTVARQYLTGIAASTWDPGAGVAIYDNAGLTFVGAGGTVAAEGGLAGSIDGSGEYSVAAPDARLSAKYLLTRAFGEWRISQPPIGLILGPGDIDRGFRSFNMYFFTRDFGTLVPTPVVIPVSEAGVATQLVRELLVGPPTWIAPSVRTGFPEGTRLAFDSVPVVDGVADVALTAEVLQADDATRQALSAQLAWTLRQLPSITSIRLTVSGQRVVVPGVGLVQPVSAWQQFDPNASPAPALGYALNGKNVMSFDSSGQFSRVSGLKRELTSLAVDLQSANFAALSKDRKSLWVGLLADQATLVRRYVGSELSRPSWDRDGSLWVVDRGLGLLNVRDTVATQIAVTGLPDGVADSDILDVAVARDGTRIALLIRRGTRVEPIVARVERTGGTVRVADPRRIEASITDALDLAWHDSATLSILGTSGASSLAVFDVGVGTSRVIPTRAPEGSTTLAAQPDRPTLVGTGADIYRASANSWTKLGPGTDPVYPG
ncbi:MAG: LpqB family beta-propeller domain-containing protein [Actinomycetes bacterium]